jgi:hypothetical protein
LNADLIFLKDAVECRKEVIEFARILTADVASAPGLYWNFEVEYLEFGAELCGRGHSRF